MISVNEIRKKAREQGVPETTVERDYLQNRFLNELFSETENLAFKGGTAIRKIYVRDYRFSDDLDFTLRDKMERAELAAVIKKSKDDAKNNAGIGFEDDFELVEVANGWKALLHCRSSMTSRISINIKLDMTEFGRERIFLPVEKRAIFHDFSDSCDTKIATYSLNEIMAEKMRALFDRGWPRDFYDVYRLWDVADMDVAVPTFEKKCEFKGIKPDIDALNGEREQLRSGWNSSLGHQMKSVPGFDEMFESLLGRLKVLNIW
jgi:predicted nucleotidyltransferase component of viral defense system